MGRFIPVESEARELAAFYQEKLIAILEKGKNFTNLEKSFSQKVCYNKFMNIRTITTANQIHLENETVLVLGYFDGLHLGHQELFKKARQIADEKGLKVALLTFPESPKLAFVRYQPELLLHLQSPEDRFQN